MCFGGGDECECVREYWGGDECECVSRPVARGGT